MHFVVFPCHLNDYCRLHLVILASSLYQCYCRIVRVCRYFAEP